VAESVSVGDFSNLLADPDPLVMGSRALARPKSRSFTFPSGVSLTFAGFKSRWTIPCSCAASRASAICRAMASASGGRSGPEASRAVRSSPGTSSMARKRTPLASCSPWMPAIPG
jgi:hypothetical protein